MASCTCADPSMVANSIKSHADTTSRATAQAAQLIDETLYGSEMGGSHGAPAPVRFCHWLAPEISDVGESNWSIAWELAALGIAITNGIIQSQIADKQQDLADSYYQMAKYKWDRFANKYMPLEKKLLQEVSTEPIREIDCAGARDRAQTSVNSAYNDMSNYMARKAKSLRLCIDPSLISVVDHKRAVMLVDTENYNLNDERWFTDYKNDQRWNRRSNVLNLGRNLTSEAMKYGDAANALYSQVGRQVDRAAQGLIGALGYYGARNDTYYPTTYLGSTPGNVVSLSTPNVSSGPGGSGLNT